MYKMEPILLNQLKLILQPDHQVEDLQRRTLKDITKKVLSNLISTELLQENFTLTQL